jgi:hypothetical protein
VANGRFGPDLTHLMSRDSMAAGVITHMLAHVFSASRDDDLLGGMWAVAATIFVYRRSYDESVGAALSRMAATSLSFALCLVYLILFPFYLWGWLR